MSPAKCSGIEKEPNTSKKEQPHRENDSNMSKRPTTEKILQSLAQGKHYYPGFPPYA